jgi:hypothetical protein
MESTEAVERLPWFAVTIPGDSRHVSAIRDLVVRIAQGRGFGRADAAEMAGAIDGAVRHVIAVAGSTGQAQRIQAGFRAETALEVVLTCESTDAASVAALAGEDPQRPVQLLPHGETAAGCPWILSGTVGRLLASCQLPADPRCAFTTR